MYVCLLLVKVTVRNLAIVCPSEQLSSTGCYLATRCKLISLLIAILFAKAWDLSSGSHSSVGLVSRNMSGV